MKYLLLLPLLFILELLYFKLSDKFNIIDKPNERSSHTRVTLRGGGILFYIGILLFFLAEGFQYPWFFLGLTMVTVISFADDVKPQSQRLRLLVHFIGMFLMFYQWGLFQFPWYYIVIALIVCTGIVNIYNFMDGINGLTGGYSLVITLALWYINNYQISFIENEIFYYLSSTLLVFCFFNFRTKAKCFAGDVGSVSIAFILLFLTGMLIIKTQDFSYLILLAVYIVDGGLTILHRLIRKENIFEPHRKHAYQLLANELKIPHIVVSSVYAGLQAAIVIGFFIFYQYHYFYLICILLILCVIYIILMKKYFQLHLQGIQKDTHK